VRKTTYILILTLFLSSTVNSIAQSKRAIDSLERVISQGIPDTARINALISLSDLYAFKDFTKSIQYSTGAIELAEKTKNHKLKVRAAQRLGVNYYYKGDYTNALKYESVALQGQYQARIALR
jgi:tetratricopeptide (TPR) repeat protein